jgi:hypothetical protein
MMVAGTFLLAARRDVLRCGGIGDSFGDAGVIAWRSGASEGELIM